MSVLMVGQRVARARTKANLSQDDLARKIGVRPIQVRKIELGMAKPTNLIEIATACSVDPIWLGNGTGPMEVGVEPPVESDPEPEVESSPSVKQKIEKPEVSEPEQTPAASINATSSQPETQPQQVAFRYSTPTQDVYSQDIPEQLPVFSLSEIDETFPTGAHIQGWVPNNRRLDSSAFGIRYDGADMEPFVVPGDNLVIEPIQNIWSGALVLVRYPDGPVVRQFIRDGGRVYLVSTILNATADVWSPDQEIYGVVRVRYKDY